MSHARQQIRDHIATTVTGLTTTGSRVYKSRVYPSGSDALPGLAIYTNNDTRAVGIAQKLSRQVRYELSITIEARTKPSAGTDVDAQLDDICKEVTVAVMADPTLGHRVATIDLDSTAFEFTDELERPAGIARMVFTALYAVVANAPDTLLYQS